jgi:hypothetical protein
MTLHEVLKEIDASLYPDVARAGSLDVAVSKSLADIGSNLVASTIPAEQFMPYAHVEDSSRFSQVHIAGGQRLFLFDFWSDGVRFGSGSSSELSEVARAVHTWIADKPTLEKMSSLFAFFSPTEGGKAYEAGTYVEQQWKGLIESWKGMESPFGIRSHKQLISFLFSLSLIEKARFVKGYFTYPTQNTKKYSPLPLIKAAMKRPELRQLFPYTSLTCLCFSRTTGYPFTKDCPVIEPRGNGKYAVYMPNSQEFLGEGTVEEALDIAVKNLPPDCGPAVSGTADDFVSQQT